MKRSVVKPSNMENPYGILCYTAICHRNCSFVRDIFFVLVVIFTHRLMAVIVLPIEKGTTLAKIIDNNRMTKTLLARRRAYKMRQNGHDMAWIAKKLGMSATEVRALLV